MDSIEEQRQIFKHMKNELIAILIALTFFGCAAKTSVNTDEVLNSCVDKVKKTAVTLADPNEFPKNIGHGKQQWKTSSVRDWTSGFWPGILWYSYELSGDNFLKEQAEKFTAPLEIISKSPARNHDIGFQIYCSYGNAYRLTGNQSYKKVMLAAADTLATLYNPIVGTILSWPSHTKYLHNTIIDNMMNLELLFWASKNGGGQHLYDIAVNHAETSMKTLIRPDFSTFHLASYDTIDGQFLKGYTHQGYANDSQWARGQAWAIYGYAMCYRETGNDVFAETCQKLADTFINRLPDDGIPFWDFDDPSIPDAPKDASAAAIAACGMLELYKTMGDKAAVEKYRNAAESLISKLSTENFLSGDNNQAILMHSTGNYPKGSEVDVPIIYADYYFMEALLRLKGLEKM